MPVVRVSTIQGSADGDTVTTAAIDTTTSDFIAVAVALTGSGSSVTITDSEGNSFVSHGAYTGGANSVQWYSCANPNVSANHTFSTTLASRCPTIAVVALNGVTAFRTDDGTQSNGATTNTSPSVTPLAADELLLSALMFANTDTVTADPPLTVLQQTTFVSGERTALAVGWGVTPNTTPLTTTWDWTNSCVNAQHLAVFSTHAVDPDPIEGSAVFGVDGTVESTRTVLFSLDGATNTVNKPGGVTVKGYLDVTGDTTVEDLTINGSVTGFTLPADSVTNTELADMTQATIKGRAAAAGTGDPTDLTADQVSTILDAATDPFLRTSALPSAGDLDDLSDVIITAPSTGEVLKYNGSNWINDTDATGGGGGGVDTTTAAYASRPAAGNAGDLFLPTDGFHIERDTGAAWQSWGPIFPMVPPVDASFAWVNQGGASVAASNGGVFLAAPASASNSWRIRKMAAPATPYVVTAAIRPMMRVGNNQRVGILFRESGTSELSIFYINLSTTQEQLLVDNWTNETTFSATVASTTTIRGLSNALVFLRIEDNGTNRVYSFSYDGQNFQQVFSVTRTTFLTADEIGFGLSDNSSVVIAMTVFSWKVA